VAKVAVKQTPDKEVPTEVLADSIVAISRGVRQLRSGRLTDRALLLLIQDAALSIQHKPISQREIKAVLEGIDNLERMFLKKKTAA
jgi:hypothetical protein